MTILAVIAFFRYGLPDDGGESLRKRLKEERYARNVEENTKRAEKGLPPAIFRQSKLKNTSSEVFFAVEKPQGFPWGFCCVL